MFEQVLIKEFRKKCIYGFVRIFFFCNNFWKKLLGRSLRNLTCRFLGSKASGTYWWTILNFLTVVSGRNPIVFRWDPKQIGGVGQVWVFWGKLMCTCLLVGRSKCCIVTFEVIVCSKQFNKWNCTTIGYFLRYGWITFWILHFFAIEKKQIPG